MHIPLLGSSGVGGVISLLHLRNNLIRKPTVFAGRSICHFSNSGEEL